MNKNIPRQIVINYIFTIATISLNFLWFSLITRYVTTEDYGYYSIAITSITLITHVFSLNLAQFYIKNLANLKTNEKIRKIKSITPIITIIEICIAIISIGFIYFLDIKNNVLVYLVILIAITKSTFFPIINFLTSEKKISTVKLLSFVVNQSWIIILIPLILAIPKIRIIDMLALNLLLTVLLFLLTQFIFLKKYKTNLYLSSNTNRTYLTKAMKYSIPLLSLIITQWVLTASDRYFLAFFYNAQTVALYSYIYSLLAYTFTLSAIIIEVFYPYLAETYKTSFEKFNLFFNYAIKYSLLVLIPMLIGFYALNQQIITLISGTKYLESLKILPFLISFPILQLLLTLLTKPLLLSGKTKKISKYYFYGMLANIILNLILIPKFSYYGASIATIISYLVICSLFYKEEIHQIRINHKIIKTHKLMLIGIFFFIIMNLFNPQIYIEKIITIFLGVIIYGILVLIFLIIDKNEINFLKKILKLKN